MGLILEKLELFGYCRRTEPRNAYEGWLYLQPSPLSAVTLWSKKQSVLKNPV